MDASKRDAEAGARDATSHDAGADGTAPGDSAADAPVVTPTLTALSVTWTDGGASALVPDFSPSVHDYYVQCAAGTNDLVVTLTAAAGAEASLTEPLTSTMTTTPVSATENQAIVALVTEGTATAQYWVRCLPHDFPKLEMVTHPEAGAPSPGYYLLGNLQAKVSAGYAMILDGNGVPVWYHAAPAGLGVVDVDDVVAGAVSFITSSNTSAESFELHGLSPVSSTTIGPDGYTTDEHELRKLSNGDYLVLSYPLKGGFDLTGLSIAVGDGGTEALGPGSTIQDCTILEFDSTGTVKWTWNASDHFNPADDSTLPLTGFGPGATLPDGGTVYDVFHCNAIDVDPANGNLLVSAREMDSVFYVDRTSGAVLWKMGGSSASLDNAAYVSVADPFFRQHDARLQPGWSSSCNGGQGQVSLFDDESAKPGPARGVVYDVVVGGTDAGSSGCDAGSPFDGGTPGQATVAWQYKGALSSAATGSFRILADGSRVIDWGIGGTPNLVFTEVSESGADLLDFEFTDGNGSYRTIKVPLATFDLETLRQVAGQ